MVESAKEREFSEKVFNKVLQSVNVDSVKIDSSIIDDGDDLSPALLIKMMEEPCDFLIQENGELYVTINGEDHNVDPKIDNKGDLAIIEGNLIKSLPNIPWDVNCQGNRRKQQEAFAAYKIICVNHAVGGLYESKISEVISSYDFKNFRGNSDDNKTFLKLFNLIEQDAGSVIKFLISCCSLKLTSKKMKGERPYIGILPSSDVEVLENFQEMISNEEARTSKLLEKENDRLKRLILLRDKDKIINDIIASEVSGDARLLVLFKISKLTTDDLPSRLRIEIRETVRNSVTEEMTQAGLIDEDLHSKLVKKLSRRALRQAVRTYQQEKFKSVMNANSNWDDLLPKT